MTNIRAESDEQQTAHLHLPPREGQRQDEEERDGRMDGHQNFCSGTPVPGWIIAKDEGGDALHSGVSTRCS